MSCPAPRSGAAYRVECHMSGCNWVAWYENEATAHREGQRHELDSVTNR